MFLLFQATLCALIQEKEFHTMVSTTELQKTTGTVSQIYSTGRWVELSGRTPAKQLEGSLPLPNTHLSYGQSHDFQLSRISSMYFLCCSVLRCQRTSRVVRGFSVQSGWGRIPLMDRSSSGILGSGCISTGFHGCE